MKGLCRLNKYLNILLGIAISIAWITFVGYAIHKNQKSKTQTVDAYFTEDRLSEDELSHMIEIFYVKTDPYLRTHWLSEIDATKWPDYSDYKMEATQMTDKSVALINYYLFQERGSYDEDGIERAEKLGFSEKNPLTTEWVMDNPKDAVSIVYGMTSAEDMVNYIYVNEAYNKIIGGNDQMNAETVTKSSAN